MRFAGCQEGIQEPLDSPMGQQPLTKIVQEGEVKPRVVQVQTQRIFPIYTAADRICRLAIRQAFDILHHHHEGHAPGGDLHGAALRG